MRPAAPTRPRLVAAGLALTAGLAATAVVAPAPARAAATLTAHPSTRSAVAGATVTVTGVAPAGDTVRLERRYAPGWQPYGRAAHVAADGTYRLEVPTDWYADHHLRVADLDGSSGTRRSDEFTVAVTPRYRPAGRASSYQLMWDPGVRFDPCTPITWRFDRAGGFAGDLAVVKAAVAEVGRATGLRFDYQGGSKLAFTSHRDLLDTNILLDWATPSQVPALAASVVGYARSFTSRLSTQRVAELMGGNIALDRTAALGPHRRSQLAAVVMHELSHVIGLEHVQDRTQLMNPVVTASRFGAGDLAGLAALGADHGCVAHSARTS